jgi:hypothetical protein
LTILLVALASSASAAPSSRLVYARGEGGDACPDEAALRKAVAARVGYDPFFPWAAVTVTAEVRRVGAKLHGRVTLVDGAGMQRGVRELESDSDDCAELVSSVALAIAIALDGLSVEAPPPEPVAKAVAPPVVPEPAPSALPDAGPPPPAERPRASAPGLRGFATVGAQGALGTAPSLAAGVTIGAGVRYEWLGAALEGRYDLPASTTSANGGARAELVTVSLLPCAHLGVFLGCARGSVGETIGEGADVPLTRSRAAPYVSVGARAGLELPVAGPVEVRGHLDLDVPLTRTTLQVNDAPVWSTPPLAAAAGLAGLVRFP